MWLTYLILACDILQDLRPKSTATLHQLRGEFPDVRMLNLTACQGLRNRHIKNVLKSKVHLHALLMGVGITKPPPNFGTYQISNEVRLQRQNKSSLLWSRPCNDAHDNSLPDSVCMVEMSCNATNICFLLAGEELWRKADYHLVIPWQAIRQHDLSSCIRDWSFKWFTPGLWCNCQKCRSSASAVHK